jgi:ketosteroid isomerase-like protein
LADCGRTLSLHKLPPIQRAPPHVEAENRHHGEEPMSEKNIQAVQSIYAAFGRGDVPAILEFIADDLRLFGVVSQSKEVPWHLQITKKKDVPLFFQALAQECDFTRFEPRDFAAAGDHVYCTIRFDVRFKRNGQTATYEDVMHRFTFKNGRVVEWRGTEDTANTVALLLR